MRQADVPLTLTAGGGHTMTTWRAQVPSMLTWMTPGLARAAQKQAAPPPRKAAHPDCGPRGVTGLGRVAADLDLRAVQLAAAGRAVQDRVELAAAAGVGEQRGRPLGRAEPPVAPVEHHHDVREEGPALVREPVLDPARAGLGDDRLQHAHLAERAQPVRDDGRRRAHHHQHVGEPAGAEERGRQGRGRPAVADQLDGLGHQAGTGRAARGPAPGGGARHRPARSRRSARTCRGRPGCRPAGRRPGSA